MVDFAESPKWKLVNAFTIHEDHMLKDRPFMRTCVPKRLNVEISSFQVIHLIQWPEGDGEDTRPNAYTDSSYIRFSGDLDHRINVFTMDRGEVGFFQTLTDATIRPLAVGQIGGKHRATVIDGIYYSGMSSRDVPAEGLMEGEPGALTFLSEFQEQPGSEKVPPSLTATLFLDEDKFSGLLATLSFSQRPAVAAKLNIVAELFESEMSASLSEPWMTHDYGLLMKGKAVANTRARIETIALSTGETKLNVEGGQQDGNTLDNMLRGANHENIRSALPDYKALLKIQRYIFVALLVLIAVTFFSR